MTPFCWKVQDIEFNCKFKVIYIESIFLGYWFMSHDNNNEMNRRLKRNILKLHSQRWKARCKSVTDITDCNHIRHCMYTNNTSQRMYLEIISNILYLFHIYYAIEKGNSNRRNITFFFSRFERRQIWRSMLVVNISLRTSAFHNGLNINLNNAFH